MARHLEVAVEVVIIGAGITGMRVAARLARAGVADFVILEASGMCCFYTPVQSVAPW